MIVAAHQPQYIPWLGYFDKIARCDCFVFLDCVQYKPREFQNRNKIRTKAGPIWLSVPVVCKGRGRQGISDVIIDNNFPWRRRHLNALKTAYGRADYFDNYINFFNEVYTKDWVKLIDLNVEIINYILMCLGISKPIYFESILKTKSQHTDRIIEICEKLKADTYLSGMGGKDYLEEDKFSKRGIKLIYQEFKHPTYKQQFMSDENDFIPFMSILDLLFNEGPNSKQILKLHNIQSPNSQLQTPN